jgi:branched-chain amino acid transport system substrate-binding protein
MRGTAFQTVLGPISFDDKGDVEQPAYVFYRWHDGKYVPIEDLAEAG